MAVNCSPSPTIRLGEPAVTVMDVSTAAVTVKLKDGAEVTPFKLAVMFVLPGVMPLATPCVPAVLLMVATAVLEEVQVTAFVRSCVEPSE